MTNPLIKSAARAMGQPAPAATHRAAGDAVARNAFGVPVIAPRVTAIARYAGHPGHAEHGLARAAGDAFDDLRARIAADPNYEFTEADYALMGLGGSTPSTTAPANQLTEADRQRIAAQNMAIINAVGSAITGGAAIVTEAIRSGNAVEIERIRAESAARVIALRNEALATTNPAQQQALLQQAAQASQLQMLMQQLQGARSNNQMLLIGGLAVAGLVAVYMFTRGGGGARRNPSHEAGWPHYNPVMERTHVAKRGKRRGKRVRQVAWFKPEQVGRARRRGWKKAR